MNATHLQAEVRPIHPFPARMAPAIVWDELPVANGSRRRLKVLDPMSGSGTSLVCASIRGHHAIGRDRDPLALLISTVWCSPVPEDLLEAAFDLLQQARRRARSLKARNAFPLGADD